MRRILFSTLAKVGVSPSPPLPLLDVKKNVLSVATTQPFRQNNVKPPMSNYSNNATRVGSNRGGSNPFFKREGNQFASRVGGGNFKRNPINNEKRIVVSGGSSGQFPMQQRAQPPHAAKSGNLRNRTPGGSRGGFDKKREERFGKSSRHATIGRVIHVGRVSRMTPQGRKSAFRALVVVGNGKGAAGVGVGKGLNVRGSLNSAMREANKDQIVVDLTPWGSLYHDVIGQHNNTKVLLRAVSESHGTVAGKVVTAICDCLGITNISSKVIGRRNPFVVVNATFSALGKHSTPMDDAWRRSRRFVDFSAKVEDKEIMRAMEIRKQKEQARKQDEKKSEAGKKEKQLK